MVLTVLSEFVPAEEKGNTEIHSAVADLLNFDLLAAKLGGVEVARHQNHPYYGAGADIDV